MEDEHKPMTAREFVLDSGRCPACGAEDPDWGEIVAESQSTYQEGSCSECGARFYTVSRLVGYGIYRDEADVETIAEDFGEITEADPEPEVRPLGVLEEFVSDVDAAGVGRTAEDWPDLIVTYRHAKAVLAKIDPVPRLAKALAGSEILVDYGLLGDQMLALRRVIDVTENDGDAMTLEALMELLSRVREDKPFGGIPDDGSVTR